MISKKEKFLESAQKFIAKGQLDRAIKDYEQVVILDPNDIRHRQRLAELLVRANRRQEAIGEYDAIGKYYADNSYYLKAIAVYKQIQKLDLANLNISLTLATLNQKQGLIGNALAEYTVLFNHYQREGNFSEAINILTSMLAADPENRFIQLKCAETRFAAGDKEQAYEEFTRLALQLMNRGDKSAFNKVCDRIQQLFPDKSEFILDTLSAQVEKGDCVQAVPRLQEIIKKDTANLRAWRLLAEAYRCKGETENLRATFRHMIRFFPDDSFVRQGLIQSVLSEGNIDGVLDLLNLHMPFFIAKREFEPLERFYFLVRALAPDDARVKEGLQHLYEASGELEKLADLTAVSPPPAGDETEQEVEPEFEDVSLEPLSSLVVEPPPSQEADWEEEIDLSNLEQMVGHPLPSDEHIVVSPRAEGDGPVNVDILSLEEGFELSPSPAEKREEGAADGCPIHEAIDLGGDWTLSHGSLVEGAPDIGAGTDGASISEVEAAGESEPVPESEGRHAERTPIGPEEITEVELEIELGNDDWLSGGMDAAGMQPEEVAQTKPDLWEETAGAEVMIQEEAEAPPTGAGETAAAEQTFRDLGEELFSESFGKDAAASVNRSKYSLDGQFSQFKKGIDQQLDEGDTETHYNLGIAYKEMGLYDDAIAEFRVAALDPVRVIDCLTLQGICCRDKGDVGGAEEVFKEGTALPGTPEEMSSLRYELALLYETGGRMEEALRLYREVEATTPDFRDVSRKIVSLQGGDESQEPLDLDLVELDAEEE